MLDTTPLAGGLRLLRNPNIRRLFVAYMTTYVGNAMAPIAMAFGVLDLTGSTRDAAIVIAAPTLAAIVVLLIGGVVADRSSRHKIMYRAEFVSMACQLAMAYLFISAQASVPLLTGLMLINGVAMAFHVPAATGIIIQLVPREELQNANAILGIARNGAFAGGAALGGLLVATIDAGPTLLLDAITFGISGILVMRMRPGAQTNEARTSVFNELKLGWREFTRHTWLWVIVVQFSLIVGAMEALLGLVGPAIARESMGGASTWGFIAASFGAGTLLGGLIAMQIRPRYPMRLGTCLVFAFAAVPIALFYAAPLAVVIGAALLSGISGQIFGVLWYTTLQIKVPGEMLSRVSAYDHLGSIALAPLGIVTAGFLFEAIGPQATLLIIIATIALPTCAALLVHDVRHMQHAP